MTHWLQYLYMYMYMYIWLRPLTISLPRQFGIPSKIWNINNANPYTGIMCVMCTLAVYTESGQAQACTIRFISTIRVYVWYDVNKQIKS